MATYTADLLQRKALSDWSRKGRNPREFVYDAAHYDHYLGAPFAWEPCLAYRASVRLRLDQERQQRAATEKPMYGEHD